MSTTKLCVYFIAFLAAALICKPVGAQNQQQKKTDQVTLSSLLLQGFEIKAATTLGVPPYQALQIVVQKGNDAYACAFGLIKICVPLTNPRLACETDLLVQKAGASGNGPDAYNHTTLSAGTELEKNDEPDKGFMSVKTMDGKSGWVDVRAFNSASCSGVSKPPG
ncbi:MAG TPA: hypothetical protein VK804_27650 [Bradyrhizobium sp.]|jgi:hypothetical protein|uniref:hypothetical protein n=1 Tax=Bradyrhizobium sp. TaxID=376 RepID=UPI002BD45DF3|nr:hypothetical protein [Bradyrhizobium sp.]HTB04260.1 hypothetical protein [Bradyrhizobium sp.]